jgi:hypothetical protein
MKSMLLAACLLLAVPALADDPDPPMTTLELAASDQFPGGKSVLMQGNADATGERFEVEGTKLLQPVAVTVFAKDPAQKIRLRLGKGNWKSPNRDVSTDASGMVNLRFHTYDGFKFWITAEQPAPYQMVVWVGEEMKKPVPSVATPMSAYKQHHGGEAPAASGGASAAASAGAGPSRMELYGVLGAVVLLFGIAMAVFARRKSS